MNIGIDIVEVSRIKKILDKENVLNKIFTKEELKYANKHRYKEITLAGRFAAKEAIKKVLEEECNFNEIEIRNEATGKPYAIIKNIKVNINISISHEKNYAVAVALKEDKIDIN